MSTHPLRAWSRVAGMLMMASLCLAATAHAQLSDGPNGPGAVFNDPAFGVPLWTDPTNAQTSDDAAASAAPGMNNTQYLHANNFGFAVPAPAVIVGIEASIERRSVAGIIKDTRVRIVKGGVIGATERGDTITPWPTVDTVKVYGGPADLWGETWSASDINASNFGIALSVNGIGDAALVDAISIEVYYELCTQTPQVVCRAATKSLFLVKDNNGDDTKDKTIFKWIKGDATVQSEFADPKTSAVYAVCVYENNALSYSMIIPPSNSLWSTISSKGFKYKDLSGTQAGIQKIILKGSTDPNKSKVLVKGKGTALPDPVPALSMPVEVQVINSDSGICWGAEFTTFKKNQTGLFKAKNP